MGVQVLEHIDHLAEYDSGVFLVEIALRFKPFKELPAFAEAELNVDYS